MEWDKFLNINIIGADFDWIEFSFTNISSNINDFAEEVYNFCPDSIDGPTDFDNIEYLKKEIMKKRLYLWWD